MSCQDLKNQLGGDDKCYSTQTTAKENNKEFRIERVSDKKESICRVQIDACLNSDQRSRKCDFLFFRVKTDDPYFVELKGTDVLHAVSQIKETVNWVKKYKALRKENVYGFIVGGSIPKSANQKFRLLQQEFQRDLGKELKRETDKMIKRL